MSLVPEVPLRGPAHGRLLRLVATAVVLAVLWGLVRVVFDAPEARSALWLVPVILGPYGLLLTSTTTIDAEGIRQSGLLERRIRWDEIAQARIGGTPFARTLSVRTLSGRFVTVRGGTPQLQAAFGRIAAAYPVG